MNSLGTGLVGYGRWGKVLALVLRRHPRFRLERICFRSAELTATTTPTLDDILQDQGIELVAVATPLTGRSAIVSKCLEAGKHVLTEKPLAASLDDARSLIAEAEARQRVLMTDFVHAHSQTVDELLDAIEPVGSLDCVSVAMRQPGPLVEGEDARTVLGSHGLAILCRIVRDVRIDLGRHEVSGEDAAISPLPSRWSWVGRARATCLRVDVDLTYPVMERSVMVAGRAGTVHADLVDRWVHRVLVEDVGFEDRATAWTAGVPTMPDELTHLLDHVVGAIEQGERGNVSLALWVQERLG